jgi:hypothetical protein
MIFHTPTDLAPWPGSQTPASVLDNLALGIAYDTDPVPIARELVTASDLKARRKNSRLPRFVLPEEIAALKG